MGCRVGFFDRLVVLPLPFWIPAPYRGTGHAFDRWNDEMSGRSLSRIVVRDMLS